MSMRRSMIVPSYGAVTRLNFSKAAKRSTSAWSSATWARAARQTGDCAVEFGLLVLPLLLRDHALGRLAPARIGGARELGFGLPYLDIGLRRLELRLRGNELCVELRGLDLGQDLPLRDMVADIDIPFRDIPGYARVDRAFVPRVRLAGQGQTRLAGCRPGRDRVDHGRRRGEGSRLPGEGVRGDEPHCLDDGERGQEQ